MFYDGRRSDNVMGVVMVHNERCNKNRVEYVTSEAILWLLFFSLAAW